MKCNVGRGDKIFRIIVGLVVISIGVCMKSWWGVIGIIPILTALLGWCPAYIPFGISSCKTKDKE